MVQGHRSLAIETGFVCLGKFSASSWQVLGTWGNEFRVMLYAGVRRMGNLSSKLELQSFSLKFEISS